MSYCLSIKVRDGIVFASDSRTHAGVDQVSSYSKMHAFELPGDRLFVLLSTGNLATTQAVVNMVQRDLDNADAETCLCNCESIFDAAQYLGELSCKAQVQHCEHHKHSKMDASFILGGQIAGDPHETYLVYPEGNCITASPSKPYLQIGEIKYGKPILDRVISPETSLEDAARCALVSLDSTQRSNISVAPPFEVAIYRTDSLSIERRFALDVDSRLYLSIQQGWSEGLRQAFEALPRFDWEAS